MAGVPDRAAHAAPAHLMLEHSRRLALQVDEHALEAGHDTRVGAVELRDVRHLCGRWRRAQAGPFSRHSNGSGIRRRW